MPTRKEVSKIKSDHIDKRKKAIAGKIDLLQQNIYDKVSGQLVTLLNKKEKDVPVNTNQLQQTVKKEFNTAFPDVMKETIIASRSLTDLNSMYFSTIMDSNRLDEIRDQTKRAIDRKLGIDENGKIKQNGFVDKALSDPAVQKQFIKKVNQLVNSGADVQTVQEKLKEFIIGKGQMSGFIQQYYSGFAGTLMNDIDRGNNLVYANKLELNYFYYSGGLILSSRPFCIDKNGKIISREQSDKWAEDPRIKKMYGKDIKDYIPLKDFGGPNCLHGADFITNDMAEGSIREQNARARARNEAFKKNNL